MSVASLNNMLVTLRALTATEEVERIAAERAARGIEDALKKTLAAGTSPDGKPWAPKKKGGGRAYKNAANKLTVKSAGNLVIATIEGGEVYGNYGAGVPERRMLPDAGAAIPELVANAMQKATDDTFREVVK